MYKEKETVKTNSDWIMMFNTVFIHKLIGQVSSAKLQWKSVILRMCFKLIRLNNVT